MTLNTIAIGLACFSLGFSLRNIIGLFDNPIKPLIIVILLTIGVFLLTSCSKEYSYEKTCIEYTTINWEDGETMKSWRQVDRPLRNDTSYSIGSARPAVVIVKTECK